MNEDRLKIRLGKKGEFKRLGGRFNVYVKSSGKFWERHFNKKVRKRSRYKRVN